MKTISSAKASTPTNVSSTITPSCLYSYSLIICFISRLKSIGDVLAPYLTPFSFCMGYYAS